METIQTKSGEVLLKELPQKIITSTEAIEWSFRLLFDLPKGYKMLGTFSELEDKDFEEFVEKEECGPNNFYFWDYNNNFAEFVKAKDSFDTLCKSQGIEGELDNYLIIKKV